MRPAPATAVTASRGGSLTGTLRVPGDKSITHRALILAALARGRSRIAGALDADDTRATAAALTALGVGIDWPDGAALEVNGGAARWRSPDRPLDLGNSGTGLRLLAGALAGRGVGAVLDGDASLRRRPMERITAPLNKMGAALETHDGCPPVVVKGGKRVRGIVYRLPIGSAQVKSALLLAGLGGDGETRIVDPFRARDHSERMLPRFGASLRCRGDAIILAPGSLRGADISVPGDPSSAAVLAGAALLARGSDLVLAGLGANPTRIGFFRLLERMGANLAWRNRREVCGEPVADLHVRSSPLSGIRVDPCEVPAAIDELPVLMVLAANAAGASVIEGAGELRHKESDRIETMYTAMTRLGAGMQVTGDRVALAGGGFTRGGRVEAGGDHRVAMALTLAGLAAPEAVTVRGAQWIQVSFPGFVGLLRAAGAGLEGA